VSLGPPEHGLHTTRGTQSSYLHVRDQSKSIDLDFPDSLSLAGALQSQVARPTARTMPFGAIREVVATRTLNKSTDDAL